MTNYNVNLTAQVVKVQTLADGTPRLWFDCQEGQTEQVAMLMAYHEMGVAGQLKFVPDIKGQGGATLGNPKRTIEIK